MDVGHARHDIDPEDVEEPTSVAAGNDRYSVASIPSSFTSISSLLGKHRDDPAFTVSPTVGQTI